MLYIDSAEANSCSLYDLYGHFLAPFPKVMIYTHLVDTFLDIITILLINHMAIP